MELIGRHEDKEISEEHRQITIPHITEQLLVIGLKLPLDRQFFEVSASIAGLERSRSTTLS